MNGDNPLGLQQQVQENSQDLQNYLKDLENWEKEMKKKEEELKLIKITEEDTIPPIRNSLSKSKKKSKHKKQKEKEKNSPTDRISGFNYKAWENFDVESELKKIDHEDKESIPSEDSEVEEQANIQQRKQLAIIKKDKGNEFFKKGIYDSAINCYTAGIELDPENPLLPANRAMAFLKKEQYQAAENDCTTCLSLDPTYIKAYLRRATARTALKKVLLAEEDYFKILELEPGNKSALAELEKIEQDNINSDVKKMLSDIEGGMSAMKENGEKPSDRLENLLIAMQQPQPIVIPSKRSSDDSKQQTSHKKSLLAEEFEWSETSTSPLEDFSEIDHVVKQLEQVLPPIPNAAYQFLTDWRKMSKYPDLRCQYLRQFPPERLPVLFKHDMEAEIFCGILETLSSSFIERGEDCVSFMKYLTQVGRFSTLLLFLSNPEKNNLKKLADHLRNVEHLTSEVEELLKLYRI